MRKILATAFFLFIALLIIGASVSGVPDRAQNVPAHARQLWGVECPEAGGVAVEKVSDAGGAVPLTPSGDKGNVGWDFIWAVIGIFFGGMALNLTPCVYPLIPVTVSYFSGQALGDKGGRGASTVFHGVLYVLGLAVMNSLLGVFAALSGRILGTVLQNPVTLIAVAGVLLVFASSMFGLWEFRLPQVVGRVASRNFAGYFGSFFIGLTLGLVAAPCLGPFVAGLLLWVASTANPLVGFVSFFSLSLGMGVPLFVLALLSGRVSRLPRSGEWMIWVRKLMGWVLTGMAAWFVVPVLPHVAGVLLLSLTALAAGVHLGWLEGSGVTSGVFVRMRKAAGILGIVLACAVLWGSVVPTEGIKWRAYSGEALREAMNAGKPIIIDFFADWCQPCRLMDRHTFHNSSVVELADRDFVPLRVDMTRSGDYQTERLAKRYNIQGVPTVLFLAPDGEEKEDLRVMEFMPPDRFLARMEELKKMTAPSK